MARSWGCLKQIGSDIQGGVGRFDDHLPSRMPWTRQQRGDLGYQRTERLPGMPGIPQATQHHRLAQAHAMRRRVQHARQQRGSAKGRMEKPAQPAGDLQFAQRIRRYRDGFRERCVDARVKEARPFQYGFLDAEEAVAMLLGMEVHRKPAGIGQIDLGWNHGAAMRSNLIAKVYRGA